eukprot:165336_1
MQLGPQLDEMVHLIIRTNGKNEWRISADIPPRSGTHSTRYRWSNWIQVRSVYMEHSIARRVVYEFVKMYGRKNQYGGNRFLGSYPPLSWVESDMAMVTRHFDAGHATVQAEIAAEIAKQHLIQADSIYAEWLIEKFGLGKITAKGWLVD